MPSRTKSTRPVKNTRFEDDELRETNKSKASAQRWEEDRETRRDKNEFDRRESVVDDRSQDETDEEDFEERQRQTRRNRDKESSRVRNREKNVDVEEDDESVDDPTDRDDEREESVDNKKSRSKQRQNRRTRDGDSKRQERDRSVDSEDDNGNATDEDKEDDHTRDDFRRKSTNSKKESRPKNEGILKKGKEQKNRTRETNKSPKKVRRDPKLNGDELDVGDVLKALQRAMHGVKMMEGMDTIKKIEFWRRQAREGEEKNKKLREEIRELKYQLSLEKTRTLRAERASGRKASAESKPMTDGETSHLGNSAKSVHAFDDDSTVISASYEASKELKKIIGSSFRQKWSKRRVAGAEEPLDEESVGESTIMARKYIDEYLTSNPPKPRDESETKVKSDSSSVEDEAKRPSRRGSMNKKTNGKTKERRGSKVGNSPQVQGQEVTVLSI